MLLLPPRSPELQRPPATEFNENEIANGGRQAAPAGRAVDGAQAGAALVRASQWIKRRNATPKLPQFQCRVFGDDPVAELRGRRRRPHHRIRRHGDRCCCYRPDRPSSSVPPQPNLTKTKSPTAAGRRPQQVALSTALRPPTPKLPQFQCRVFGDDPVAELRGRRRRPHHRIRRHGDRCCCYRPDRPSSSVPPQPNLTKTKSPTAAGRRPQQVALSTALRPARPSCARVNG